MDPGPLGTLGVGMPFALAAQLANPDSMTQMYDATTKKPVSTTTYAGPFASVLVYSDPAGNVFNPLPWPNVNGDGPLRLMVADGDSTNENVVMTGSDSVKWIVKLDVFDTVAKDWDLKLTGLKIRGVRQTRTIRRADFQSCVNCHGSSYSASGHTWSGTPLYLLVAQVDGGQAMSYNVALARKGYRIKLTSTTGRWRIVSSRAIIHRSRIVLAWERDGLVLANNLFPLRLIGPRLKASQELGRIKSVTLLPPLKK